MTPAAPHDARPERTEPNRGRIYTRTSREEQVIRVARARSFFIAILYLQYMYLQVHCFKSVFLGYVQSMVIWPVSPQTPPSIPKARSLAID